MRLRALAPAKVNLSLFLGATRQDGRHRLATIFESVSLADVIEAEVLDAGVDLVSCPGVEGDNLAAAALRTLRARGWDGPPLHIFIEKRIPVAAGMAGGSTDAATVLRLAMAVAPSRAEEVDAVAAALGADVPAQLVPGVSVGTGAGEIVERFEPIAGHAFVLLPSEFTLATPVVFQAADTLGIRRNDAQLGWLYMEMVEQLTSGGRLSDRLLVNDLEQPAIALCPSCAEALAALRAVGADHAMVSGSGPTVFGIWWGEGAAESAAAAAATLRETYPRATVVEPVAAEYGAPALI